MDWIIDSLKALKNTYRLQIEGDYYWNSKSSKKEAEVKYKDLNKAIKILIEGCKEGLGGGSASD